MTTAIQTGSATWKFARASNDQAQKELSELLNLWRGVAGPMGSMPEIPRLVTVDQAFDWGWDWVEGTQSVVEFHIAGGMEWTCLSYKGIGGIAIIEIGYSRPEEGDMLEIRLMWDVEHHWFLTRLADALYSACDD